MHALTSVRKERIRCLARPPLRVCFLIDELARAGTEGQLLALIRCLDRRKVSPYLCLLRGGSSGDLEPPDCPILRLGVGSLCRPAAVAAVWRLVNWLRKEQIDVVQCYFPDSCYLGLPTAWLAGVPHRIRVRNNLGHWLTPLHRLMARLLRPLTTLTLTNSQAGRAKLQSSEALPADRVCVLTNGVDLDRFLELPLPDLSRDRVRRIGVVANLRHVKGLDILVQAAAEVVRQYPAIFEIAGEGETRAELERMITRLGLEQSVRLAGQISDVPRFLGKLDVAVLPSRSEGMSNALLEYMAAGRPIVATSVGAAAELLHEGVHGLLVPPGNLEALGKALGWLLDHPAEARRMAAAARQRARTEFSRQAMVQRFEGFYGSLPRRTESGLSFLVSRDAEPRSGAAERVGFRAPLRRCAAPRRG